MLEFELSKHSMVLWKILKGQIQICFRGSYSTAYSGWWQWAQAVALLWTPWSAELDEGPPLVLVLSHISGPWWSPFKFITWPGSSMTSEYVYSSGGYSKCPRGEVLVVLPSRKSQILCYPPSFLIDTLIRIVASRILITLWKSWKLQSPIKTVIKCLRELLAPCVRQGSSLFSHR